MRIEIVIIFSQCAIIHKFSSEQDMRNISEDHRLIFFVNMFFVRFISLIGFPFFSGILLRIYIRKFKFE